MAYRYIGHTADIIVEGEGKTLAEAIEHTAMGIIERIGRAKKGSVSFDVEEHAENVDELVVISLSAIISGCEIRELQPYSYKVLELGEKGGRKVLKARISAGKGTAKDVVKAVTYHDLTVEEKKGSAIVRVLLDI